MPKYILSPEAQKSLKKIKAYSIHHFGIKKASRYLEDIQECFQTLAENPSLGIIREDLKVGYHSYFIEAERCPVLTRAYISYKKRHGSKPHTLVRCRFISSCTHFLNRIKWSI